MLRTFKKSTRDKPFTVRILGNAVTIAAAHSVGPSKRGVPYELLDMEVILWYTKLRDSSLESWNLYLDIEKAN